MLFIASATGEIDMVVPEPTGDDLAGLCLLVLLVFLCIPLGMLLDMLIEWGLGE